MRILAFSDLHLDRLSADQILEEADGADIIIGAGDFAQLHKHLDGFMGLLEPIAHKAIYVPGNNETEQALRSATSARVLHGEFCDVDGLRVFGIGGAIPPLPPTPWNSFDISEDQATQMLAKIPEIDVLVTHSPPHGVVDTHVSLGSIGSTSVLDAVKTSQPRLVLCGHIHDCWGMEANIGSSRVCNLGPSPRWFDLEVEKR